MRSGPNGSRPAQKIYGSPVLAMIGDDPDHTLWLLPVSAYEPISTFIHTAAETTGTA